MTAAAEKSALEKMKRCAGAIFSSMEQSIARLDERECLLEALRQGLESDKDAWLKERANQQAEFEEQRRGLEEKKREAEALWRSENRSPNRDRGCTRAGLKEASERIEPGCSVFSTAVHINGEEPNGLSVSTELFLPFTSAVSILDAKQGGYESVRHADNGIAFEVCARSSTLQLVALETCAGAIGAAAEATVYMCRGSLTQHLSRRDAWTPVAKGLLNPLLGSRLDFSAPILLPGGSVHCIYIATNSAEGIAYEPARNGEAFAQNEDLRIHAGLISNRFFGSVAGSWQCFNGRLEYSRLD